MNRALNKRFPGAIRWKILPGFLSQAAPLQPPNTSTETDQQAYARGLCSWSFARDEAVPAVETLQKLNRPKWPLHLSAGQAGH